MCLLQGGKCACLDDADSPFRPAVLLRGMCAGGMSRDSLLDKPRSPLVPEKFASPIELGLSLLGLTLFILPPGVEFWIGAVFVFMFGTFAEPTPPPLTRLVHSFPDGEG